MNMLPISNEHTKILGMCSECKFGKRENISSTDHEDIKHLEMRSNCESCEYSTFQSSTRIIQMHRKHGRLKFNQVYL